MIVLGVTASNGLDIKLAKELGADIAKVETTKFPDGEFKVRIPEIKDDKVVIVQSTYHPQERNFFELFMTAHALKSSKASVCAVVPYLAYARQNKSFLPGESVSVEAVIDMMSAVGIKSLVTVNPHKRESLDYLKGKVCEANCARTLAEGIKSYLNDPYVLAPDKSALSVAKPAAEVLGCECTHVDKTRDHYGNVSLKKSQGGKLKGKDVIIFDDMITAGSTMELATHFAYENGAASVSAACIHLVMVNGAYERLRNAGVGRIFGTNTIPFDKAEIIDVSKDVAQCVKDVFSK